MRESVKQALASAVGATARACMNGPGQVRSTAAYVLAAVDDRRRVTTPHGSFTLRAANPVGRWRADALLDKKSVSITWLEETVEDGSVFYEVGTNMGIYTLDACHLPRRHVRFLVGTSAQSASSPR